MSKESSVCLRGILLAYRVMLESLLRTLCSLMTGLLFVKWVDAWDVRTNSVAFASAIPGHVSFQRDLFCERKTNDRDHGHFSLQK
jgi:hypothetical protein